eukprot:144478_1
MPTQPDPKNKMNAVKQIESTNIDLTLKFIVIPKGSISDNIDITKSASFNFRNKEERQNICTQIMMQIRSNSKYWFKIPPDNGFYETTANANNKIYPLQQNTVNTPKTFYIMQTFIYELIVHSNQVYLPFHFLQQKLMQSIATYA